MEQVVLFLVNSVSVFEILFLGQLVIMIMFRVMLGVGWSQKIKFRVSRGSFRICVKILLFMVQGFFCKFMKFLSFNFSVIVNIMMIRLIDMISWNVGFSLILSVLIFVFLIIVCFQKLILNFVYNCSVLICFLFGIGIKLFLGCKIFVILYFYCM